MIFRGKRSFKHFLFLKLDLFSLLSFTKRSWTDKQSTAFDRTFRGACTVCTTNSLYNKNKSIVSYKKKTSEFKNKGPASSSDWAHLYGISTGTSSEKVL